MHILETEVLTIFFPAFKKAVKECCSNGRVIKIITNVPTETNSYIVKCGAINAIDFYYLGIKYATFRAEI